MAGLEQVQKILIKAQDVKATRDFLRHMGRDGLEGLVVWAGRIHECRCEIRLIVAPKQHSVSTSKGLLLSLDGDGLHELNEYLFNNRVRMIAQVHSHGEHAYHSETDNHCSIVTTLGGVSVVVPYFASGDDMIADCAVFRLGEDGWHELLRHEIRDLIEVID